MKSLDQVVKWLVIVGAINWGLVGLLSLNVVEMVLGGADSVLVRAVYVLIGLAGVYKLWKVVGGVKK